MQYGLDSAIVGGFQAMPGFLKTFGYVDHKIKIGYGIDPTFQQLIASLLTAGAFFSSLVAGFFAKYFGRKHALWLACLMNCLGITVQIATTNKGVIYLGRVLLGASNGFFVSFSNMYTSEISPAHLRGVMVSFMMLWVNIGSIIGAVANFYAAKVLDKSAYIIPLGCLYIVPVILAIGLVFVPESPRWLLYRGREQEGRVALGILRGSSIEQEYVDIEWAEMVRGRDEEIKLKRGVSWLEIYRGKWFSPNLRRTILCYASMACHAGSGTWFAISYGTYFLQIAGVDNPFGYTIMNVCFGLLGVMISMHLTRKVFGNRSLMVTTCILCAFSMMIMGIGGAVKTKQNQRAVGKALVASNAIFIFFYNTGVGTISYPIGTEVVSSRLRAHTLGSAISLGYFLAWLVGFCSPYFINPKKLNWGVNYGWIWTASNFIAAIFFYFFLPETKGRSLEEIDELFENRVSVKGFASYKTNIAAAAIRDVRGALDNKSTGTETEKGLVRGYVERIETGERVKRDDMA
ncbi:general substrate transporter [Amylocarpus encephaloides]|uniref:General substrate transporter n=1 Tax=Amylocarpus encephaloides TaxID=45428 RepID=A0A9P8BZ71_9HELO|nr:general substrate transporter [Amylocarpus encephaloides]